MPTKPTKMRLYFYGFRCEWKPQKHFQNLVYFVSIRIWKNVVKYNQDKERSEQHGRHDESHRDLPAWCNRAADHRTHHLSKNSDWPARKNGSAPAFNRCLETSFSKQTPSKNEFMSFFNIVILLK